MFSVPFVILVDHKCGCVEVFTAPTLDIAWKIGHDSCPWGFGSKFYVLDANGRTVVAPAGSVVGRL